MLTKPDIPGPNPWVEAPREKLPEGACDTHAHLFGPQEKYPYQPTRGYTPPDATETSYRQLLNTLGFQRAVLVQPSVYGTDNRRMLDTLAASTDTDSIEWRGVAVVDRHISDEELSQMNALGVRGIRINLVFPGGVTFEDIVSLAARIKPFGWHIQFFVDVSKFENLAERLSKLPVPSVVDHMGHLSTRLGIANPGFRELVDLMADGRTWVKLTGPNRISTLPEAPFTDVEPFFEALREARQDRCLFGTDWPHVQLPTPMPPDHILVNEFLRLVPDNRDRQAILVDNPATLYGF